jgi:hypothetical protein
MAIKESRMLLLAVYAAAAGSAVEAVPSAADPRG